MPWADVFVGSVSIVLGAAALWTTLFNVESLLQLPQPKSMARRWGRGGVRVFFGGLGILLIVAGCAVIAGFAPGWLGLPPLETP